jgi:Tfp pilus assembly protein PilO
MTAMLRQSSWIVTLSLAAIAVIYVTLVWLPARRAIKEMREQAESKRAFVAEATKLSETLISVQRDLSKAEPVVAQWEKTAPGKRDIPKLYGRIDALAKNAHLSIGRFDPQPFVVHEKLQEIPVTMNCSGGFAKIHEFLGELEQLPMTIWVESMRLEKSATNAKDVRCELNLVVFANNPQNSDYARHSD